ncbi:hypothetical protein KHQ06_01590 [Nocardia tengchongensis]|uniref:ESX-1 secretion-associated protein n=1 Tax=Nocardia tengchongensis TaxID=2055889 RepID=A0ABX8CPQ1_9NOCA|nr:hypothetical protein [Nocardia tengchongensis]QVI21883.1 hypothetical protein KHQ06_01590 [Nocardia tengchongensis]
MLYDKNQMTHLVETLRQYHRDLVAVAGDGTAPIDTSSDLGQACEKLKQAWSDPNSGAENGALEAVVAAKSDWDKAYANKCLSTLDAVATAVENALHNALAADAKVGQSFG